jgi:hypothetical protein
MSMLFVTYEAAAQVRDLIQSMPPLGCAALDRGWWCYYKRFIARRGKRRANTYHDDQCLQTDCVDANPRLSVNSGAVFIAQFFK